MEIVRLLQKTQHGDPGDWVQVQEETARALIAAGIATIYPEELYDSGDDVGPIDDAE